MLLDPADKIKRFKMYVTEISREQTEWGRSNVWAIMVRNFPKLIKDQRFYFEEAVNVKESLLSTGPWRSNYFLWLEENWIQKKWVRCKNFLNVQSI